MSVINPIAIVFCSVIVFASLISKKKNINIKLDFNLRNEFIEKNYKIICFALALMILFFRLWQLGRIPGGLNQDGAMSAIDAKALLQYGTDHHGMPYPVHMQAWLRGQQSALLTYLLVPIFAWFGMSEITLLIPTFLISILGLLLFGMIIADITKHNKILVLLALIIVGFNPWHFIQSRWALDANLFPHVFIIALYLLIKGIDKRKYLYISMIFFALCHYCYGISLYVVPVFLLIYAIYLCKNKLVGFKEMFICMLIYLTLSMPFFATMINTALGLPEFKLFFFTVPSFSESTRAGDILFFSHNFPAQLWNNFKALINILSNEGSTSSWNTVTSFGTIYKCMVPVSLLGLYHLIRLIKINKDIEIRSKYMAIIMYGLVALCSGLITNFVNVWRLNIFYYMNLFLILFGLWHLLIYFKKGFYLTMLALICMNGLFLFQYFTAYDQFWRGSESYSYHFKSALIYTEKRSCEVFYITPSTLTPESAEVSEIDTLFIHGVDALYYQGKVNNSNGRELNPYSQQYQYIKASDLSIDPELNAVYVINAEDKGLFAEDLFHIEEFGSFCVVIPFKFY